MSEQNVTPSEINYNQDVHVPSLEEIMNEAADEEDEKKLGKPVEETPKTEEKPQDSSVKPEDAPKPEEPKEVKPPEPAIDTEKLTDTMVNKLVEKLAPEQTTKEEKKDIREQLRDLQTKAKEEGRELTYDEALDFLHTATAEKVKSELKESLKQEILQDLQKEVEQEEIKEKEQKDAAEKYETERRDAWNKEWNSQLEDLERSGKITKVVNANDPKDPGRVERLALFQKMKEVADKRAEQGLPPILNMKEIFYEHYTSPNAKPSGASAPVGGSRRSVAPSNPGEINYNEIHNKDLYSILSGN